MDRKNKRFSPNVQTICLFNSFIQRTNQGTAKLVDLNEEPICSTNS